MCDPLLPIDELRRLKFAAASLVELFPPGSYAKENATNVAYGIKARLDWVIAQLEAADEGRKNMGAK